MKKFASLLAGVAVAAVAMPAAAAGPIQQGAVHVIGNQNSTNWNDIVTSDTVNKSHIKIQSDGVYGNNGHAQTSVGATFDLSGTVTPDCSYYVGNANTNISFGTIGIHAIDGNPNIAFTMNSNSATVNIDTNLAGCNTRNMVKIEKANLINYGASALGFDAAQFTNEIKFNAVASYTAGPVGSNTATAGEQFTVGINETQKSATHGAWKSPMGVKLRLEKPAEALVAGLYNGRVVINLSAY